MHDDRLVADDFREVRLIDEVAVAGVDRGHASLFSMLEAPARPRRGSLLLASVLQATLGDPAAARDSTIGTPVQAARVLAVVFLCTTRLQVAASGRARRWQGCCSLHDA